MTDKLKPQELAEIREWNDKRNTFCHAKMENLLDYITALEAERAELVKGLYEALEWNWLDDDWPIDVRKRLDELPSKQEQE